MFVNSLYRCSNCGNNISAETNNGLICNACDTNHFIQVTEENKNKLPIPPNAGRYADIDPNVCRDSSGFCPCGEYVTHPANEPCDAINDNVDKQERTWNCQCATEFCPCGAYVAHKVDEPCTAINRAV